MQQPAGDSSAHPNYTREVPRVQSAGGALRAVESPATPRRTADLDAWHRAVTQAPDLAVYRGNGKVRVSSAIVKTVVLALRHYMDGPKGRDPGGNAAPGAKRLAGELDLSEDVVKRSLDSGVNHGYLKRTRDARPGYAAVFAAALPPVDNSERMGRRPTRSPETHGSTTHPSDNAWVDDPRNAWVDDPPHLRSTSETPTPHAREATQLPLVAGVTGGGEEVDRQTTGTHDIVVELGCRLGLTIRAVPPRLGRVVDRLTGAGWSLEQLARDPRVGRPLPDEVTSPAGLLATRLQELVGVDPPHVERARRQVELAAELGARPPLDAPGRPPGPVHHLDHGGAP